MQASLVMRKTPLPQPPTRPSPPRAINKPKVMVVESDPDSREIIKTILEMDGCCEVLELDDAERAFAPAFNDGAPPALIVVDIGFDDLVTMGRLRQHATFQQVPIIVTSANALPSFQKRVQDIGCTYFFTKPYDPYELLSALKPYLNAGR